MFLIIGSINKQVAVFESHILKNEVEKIIQIKIRSLVSPKRTNTFNAILLCKQLFSKP